MLQDIILPDHDYLLKLGDFPCTFNLESIGNITLSRLKYIQHNLTCELNIENDTQEEITRKKNLLMLIEFRLGNRNRALQLNDQVIHLTSWRNISSLGNRCFIMVSIGDEPEAKKCLNRLKMIKKCHDTFDVLLTEAYAEQAYCYSRLGGPDNLKRAISLFTLAVKRRPDNYLWKYGLGLVYRRATHRNIYCSSSDRLDVEKYQKMAMKYFFDVGDHAVTNNLRAMAYAQLVKLRQDIPPDLFPQYNSLFRYQTLQQLCDKALQHGGDSPSVLTLCGRSLQSLNLEKAVILLEKSVAIKSNTIAYHQLGLCYKRQAELAQKEEIKQLGKSTVVCDKQLHKNIAVYSCPHGNMPSDLDTDSEQTEVNETLGASTKMITKTQKDIISFGALNRTYYKGQNHHLRPARSEDISNRVSSFKNRTLKPDTSKFRVRITEPIPSYKNTATLTTPYQVDENIRYRSVIEGWGLHKEVESCLNAVPLDMNTVFVQKAISCYKQAIQISNGENLPAVLDLGLILKQTGQVREALTHFNNVTNSHLSLTNHRVTVISAYEQAGLCYLELNKTDKNKNNFAKDGQMKLTKAVSLAADLASLVPEFKYCAHKVWTALKTLLTELDKLPAPLKQHKEKIKLLELVRDHGQIIEVVQKLRDTYETVFLDKDVVRSALNSYLMLQEPENALAFQNVVGLGQSGHNAKWWESDLMRALRTKVLLHALYGRLKGTSDNPRYLFQKLFQHSYGACVGFGTVINGKKAHLNSQYSGDLLVVYDEDQESEEGLSPTMKTAQMLARLSSCCFSLEASENLKGTGEYGDLLPIQLKEIRKFQVVIFVLGSEERDRMFDAMLERVSCNIPTQTTKQRILVVDAGLREGQVPLCLRQYECLKLEDIGGLGDIDHGPGDGSDGSDQISFMKIVQQGFRGDADAIMKLFCFIIGQQWPCP